MQLQWRLLACIAGRAALAGSCSSGSGCRNGAIAHDAERPAETLRSGEDICTLTENLLKNISDVASTCPECACLTVQNA